MQVLISQLKPLPLVKALLDYCMQYQQPVWLVGGVVRDYLLTGEISPDVDVVVMPEAITAGMVDEIAEITQASKVVLDAEEQIYRLVLTTDDVECVLDIAQCQGETIKQDLTRRDLTLNAIAIEVMTAEVIDPYNGVEAIQQKRLQGIDDQNLMDDPLRLLRVFRFYSQLPGFSIDDALLEAVTHYRGLFNTSKRPKPERIHQELQKLFAGENVLQALKTMHDFGMLEAVYPSNTPLDTTYLDALALLLSQQPQDVLNTLELPLTKTVKTKAVLWWLLAMSPNWENLRTAKGMAAQCWPRAQQQVVAKVLNTLNTALVDFFTWPMPEQQKLFLNLGPQFVLFYLLGQLMPQNTANAEQWQHLWPQYQQFMLEEQQLPQLLNGHQVCELLNIKAGPQVGQLLEDLRWQQRAGIVKTTDQAKIWLQNAAIKVDVF